MSITAQTGEITMEPGGEWAGQTSQKFTTWK